MEQPRIGPARARATTRVLMPHIGGHSIRRFGTVGEDHPSVAITLNNLAVTARRRARPEEAEALYRRALAILEGRVEPDHPSLVLTVRNYAKLLRDVGREAEAEQLERRWKETGASAVS